MAENINSRDSEQSSSDIVSFNQNGEHVENGEEQLRSQVVDISGAHLATSSPIVGRSTTVDGEDALIVTPGLLGLINQLGKQFAEANKALGRELGERIDSVNERVAESKRELSERVASVNEKVTAVKQELGRQLEDNLTEIRGQLSKTNEVVEDIRKEVNDFKITVEAGLGQANARVDVVEAKIIEVESNLTSKLEKNEERVNTLDLFVQQENKIVRTEIRETRDALEGKINNHKASTEIRETRDALEGKINNHKASTDREIAIVNSNLNACQSDVRDLSQKVTLLKEDVIARNVGGSCGINWANIVVKTYPGDGKIHPIDFLYHIRDNFTVTMTDSLKIKFVKKFLDNEALAWAHQTIRENMTYEEFERCFINKFWSQRTQARVMNEFLNGVKYRESDGSMKDFCEAQLRKLVHLDSQFNEMTQIDALKRKLPSRLQQDLRFASDESIEDFLKFVGKLDSSEDRSYGSRRYQDDRNNDQQDRGRRDNYRTNRDYRDRSREDRGRYNEGRSDRGRQEERGHRDGDDRRNGRRGDQQEN